MSRLGPTLGLWQRIKRLALTDVGALARGLNANDLEQMEQLLIEADFALPATLDLPSTSKGRYGREGQD